MREFEQHLTRPEARPHTENMPEGNAARGPEAPRGGEIIPQDRVSRYRVWRKFFEDNPGVGHQERSVYRELENVGRFPPNPMWNTEEEGRLVDRPVEITRYVGLREGREYVRVEGIDRDVPLDEIEFSQTAFGEGRRPFDDQKLANHIAEMRIKDEAERKKVSRRDSEYQEFHDRLQDYGDRKRRIFPTEKAEKQYKAGRLTLSPEQTELLRDFRIFEHHLIEDINQKLDTFPLVETDQFPREFLPIVAAFRETRERLINRLMFRAYEDKTEAREYGKSMSLYATANLDTLIGETSKYDPERYEELQGIETAAELFHSMNASMLTGSLDHFMRIAERINYHHLTYMQGVRGVSEAMRLFEEKYAEIIARDKTITAKNYEDLKREVREALERSNKLGLLKSEFEDERLGPSAPIMKQWEVERAVNVARTFFNITFRAAEQISTGQVPKALKASLHNQGRYSSPPMEQAVRIMNWAQWLLYRFNVGDSRGGPSFLNMVKKNYQEFLRKFNKKRGENRIAKFGGMVTDELEAGGMFSVSGLFSSWRNEDMLATKLFVTMKDGKTMTVKQWLEDNEPIIDAAKKKGEAAFTEALSPLIEAMPAGLGWLIKHGMLEGNMEDGDIGYNLRKRLWQRVARENLPLMINYLTGLEFGKIKHTVEKEKEGRGKGKTKVDRDVLLDKGTPPVKSFEKLSDEFKFSDEALASFRERVALDHQRRVSMVAQDMRVKAAEAEGNQAEAAKARAEYARLEAISIGFSQQELDFIAAIQKEGEKIAPDLADIQFPYLPFMNDLPFEMNYQGAGTEFYRRRNGDLVGLDSAQKAFQELMLNPGGLNPEEVFEKLKKIIQGIEGPHGTSVSQDKVYPMINSWMEVVETKKGQRQIIYKSVKEQLRKSTSIGQEWAGPEALSISATQQAKMIDQAWQQGIIDAYWARELRKDRYNGWLGLLWELLENYWYIGLVIAGKQMVGEATGRKAA